MADTLATRYTVSSGTVTVTVTYTTAGWELADDSGIVSLFADPDTALAAAASLADALVLANSLRDQAAADITAARQTAADAAGAVPA